MSDEVITRACAQAHVEDALRWRAFIGAEREKGPAGDHWRELRTDFVLMESGQQPRKDSELGLFIRGLKGKVASILLVALGLFAAPRGASAAMLEVGSAESVKPPVYTLCAIGRRCFT